MAQSSQRLEPPQIPGRFIWAGAVHAQNQKQCWRKMPVKCITSVFAKWKDLTDADIRNEVLNLRDRPPEATFPGVARMRSALPLRLRSSRSGRPIRRAIGACPAALST